MHKVFKAWVSPDLMNKVNELIKKSLAAGECSSSASGTAKSASTALSSNRAREKSAVLSFF
jgi:hypothetical protein